MLCVCGLVARVGGGVGATAATTHVPRVTAEGAYVLCISQHCALTATTRIEPALPATADAATAPASGPGPEPEPEPPSTQMQLQVHGRDDSEEAGTFAWVEATVAGTLTKEAALAAGLLWCTQPEAAAACATRNTRERRKRGHRLIALSAPQAAAQMCGQGSMS